MLNRIWSFVLSPQLSLILLGLMAIIPFLIFYHRLPIPSFYGEWAAAVLGVAALLPLLKRESWQPLQIPHVALIFPGLLALLFMQWMLGMLHSTPYALMAASYLVWAFFLVILGNHLRQQLGWEKMVDTFAWFLLVGGVINGLFVLLQIAMNNGLSLPFMPRLRGYGAIAQVNQFADYMAMAFASLLFLHARRRLGIAVLISLGVMFLAMLAFSGSRSTWLYLAALAGLMILLRGIAVAQASTRSSVELQQSRVLFRLGLAILPAYALVQFVMFMVFNTLSLEKMSALPTERLMDEAVAVSGLTIRLHLWQESLQLFLQSPWLGIGLGQMRWQSFQLLNADAAAAMPQLFEHAHNLFIHLMTEMGVGALLLTLAALWTWLYGFQWRQLTLQTWWLVALLAIMGIHSLLEYPMWYTYFLGFATVLLGAGEQKCAQVRMAFSGRAAVVAVLVLAVAHLGSTFIANQKIQGVMYQGLTTGFSAKERDRMFEDMTWVQEKSLLAPYVNIVYANVLVPDETFIESKLAITESALRFMPTRPIAYRYALLLALNRDRPAAVAQLHRALAAFPGGFTKLVRELPFQYWEFYIELLHEARPDLGLIVQPEATGDAKE